MEIKLEYGYWYINGYVIEGDEGIVYNVYRENAEAGSMPLFDSESFEKCLIWCYSN